MDSSSPLPTGPYGRPLYYDLDGVPLSTWGEVGALRADAAAWRVGLDARQDAASGSVRVVSTVWLGIDQSFLATGAPLIFETMTFEAAQVMPGVLGMGEAVESYTVRWSTREQAREGHAQVVAWLERDGWSIAVDAPDWE